MDHFSLWILDENFLPSVALLVVGGFLTSFVVAKLATSRAVHQLLLYGTPAVRAKKRQQMLEQMCKELSIVLRGRAEAQLSRREKDHLKRIRAYYYRKLDDME
jgi:hypothetical protein